MFDLESKRPKILVVGDLMIDHYVWGNCERISPEAPVQVVDVQNENNRLGGACNVAHNLVALHAKVYVCGVIGNDEAGTWLGDELESLGVDISYLFVDTTRPTTKKTRILIGKSQVLRVDRENKKPIDSEITNDLMQRIHAVLDEVDCVIISDYGKGLLSYELTQHIIAHARNKGKIVLCDPKGKDYRKYEGATLLTPNKKEAEQATGIVIDSADSLLEAGLKLKKQCALDISLITLSEDGIGLFDDGQKEYIVPVEKMQPSKHIANTGQMWIIPTKAREVYDVTGAGDTVIAALGFALSSGCDIYQACEFANAAAAVVVGKVGSASATHTEIMHYLHMQPSPMQARLESKIIAQECIPALLRNLKGSKIIFTNGCFDILHRGHISYLSAARDLGDVLIVGLNDDDSIRRLKGKSRPIHTLNDRAYMLAGLECVDYIISFDEDTPLKLIDAIRPDVLVKGADYEGKEIVGAEFSKEVRLIEFVEGYSTSKIVENIQKID